MNRIEYPKLIFPEENTRQRAWSFRDTTCSALFLRIIFWIDGAVVGVGILSPLF